MMHEYRQIHTGRVLGAYMCNCSSPVSYTQGLDFWINFDVIVDDPKAFELVIEIQLT